MTIKYQTTYKNNRIQCGIHLRCIVIETRTNSLVYIMLNNTVLYHLPNKLNGVFFGIHTTWLRIRVYNSFWRITDIISV